MPPPVEQLERAKAMSISLIQGALESKAASAEDLGRQILTYGHRCVAGCWHSLTTYQCVTSIGEALVAQLTRLLEAGRPDSSCIYTLSSPAGYQPDHLPVWAETRRSRLLIGS